jgi:glycosyltransferase involved in cell wall biosynthesis
MKNNISILLSTYNSDKYLSQQIDSILAQTYTEWELIIRDDGSTDNTLQIIHDYCKRYPKIIMLESYGENLGTKNSFIKLLEYAHAQYYMFCDHDDVWLPFKIEITYEKMKEAEQNNLEKPIIVCTDLIVTDEKLQNIHNSMWKYSRIFPDVLNSSYQYLVICNFVTGCTMMINQIAKEISFPVSINATLHDNWIALKVKYSCGIIVPISTPTIYYRQHDKNICGATPFPENYIINKLKNILIVYKENRLVYKMAKSIGNISIFIYIVYKIKYFIKRK